MTGRQETQGANVHNGEPPGARRLIEELRRQGFSAGRGAALYATPGTTVTAILAGNPVQR